MKKILSIDTTGSDTTIALFCNGKFFSINRNIKSKNYESIISLINLLLDKSKLNIRQIDYFAVCVGPGSFTGIRIGLSSAKALAYCMNIPLIGYRSLDIYAWMNKDDFRGLLCIMQDARRNNIYSAVFSNYDGFKRIGPYGLGDIWQLLEKLKRIKKEFSNRISDNYRATPDLYFYGDIVSHYQDDIKQAFPHSTIISGKDRRHKAKAMIFLSKSYQREKSNSFSLTPFYMYPKECQIKTVRKNVLME